MSQHVGELEYTEAEELKYGANYTKNENENSIIGGNTEIHLIETGDSEETEEATFPEDGINDDNDDEPDEPEEEEYLSGKQCEARLIAKRIKELMNADNEGNHFQIYDKGKRCYRNLKYRDIVILLRTVRGWSDIFTDEFTDAGVPTFADIGTGFLKNSEVRVILSLLRIIDNPLQDIPLLSVMRSPIVSLTADELAEIRMTDNKLSVYETLKITADNKQNLISAKAARFLSDLNKWREMSVYMPTDKLIWQLYSETGYYGIVGAMQNGEQRQANLRILFERAKKFEDTSYKGLFNFINFIDKVEGSKGDMGSAKILGENDNVVRIMSIHKSKGLEFPVVFLAGCGKKFNLQDLKQSILLHQDLGFGPDIVDNKLRVSYPSAIKTTIASKMRVESLSEEMRILYVAMTRAREKLIITGAFDNVGKLAEKWAFSANEKETKLPSPGILKENCYIDWIGPALMRNKSCGALRKLAEVGDGFEGLISDDSTKFDIKIWNKNDLVCENTECEIDRGNPETWFETNDSIKREATISEIDRRLGYEYAFKKVSNIPVKVTVTEMKKRFEPEETEEDVILDYSEYKAKKPMFLEEKKGLTAAEKGTIIHFVMQHLELNEKGIKEQIDNMVKRELLTMQQAETVDIKRIERFFDSSLGKRMIVSKKVRREIPFNIEIACSELYKDLDDEIYKDESLLLQGIIDCYFEEDGGLVLLDYKTDRIPDRGTEIIKNRYATQINYYAEALKKLTGKEIKNKYVYLFSNGEILEY
jgi:ATP-dependent helicase/nuclease subunit A